MTKKILITDYDFPDVELEQELAGEADIELETAQVKDPDAVIEAGEDADALLIQYAQITEEVFEALDLEAVGRYGIGVDSIDISAATQHGARVLNVPTYCLDEVSTHAFALLLACVREVPHYDEEIKGGTWDWTTGKPIHRLRGQTIGLAGFGKIPREVAGKAEAFGMDVIAYDPYLSAEEIAEHGAEKVDFDELLDRSDVVSAHTPLTEETRGLFDAEAFEAMNDSATLINTARGGVVDVDDLADALEADEIAAAGLDVMPEEPPAEDTPLLDRDDVVLTPHVAWYSEESFVELRSTVTEDVIRVLEGEEPRNLVNEDVTEA